MKHFLKHTSLFVFLLLFAGGCNELFSPKGPFEQRLVTYSVLSPMSDTQYVRVYLNYNPPGFDPYADTRDRADTTALVTISGAGETVSFHDILIIPSDQSRFSTLHAFVSSLFRPQPSTEYTLTVVSPKYGTVTASTQSPGKGILNIYDMSTLLFPENYLDGTIDVDVMLDSGTKGFIVRFVLVSAIQNNSTLTTETEIPLTYYQNAAGTWIPVYGTLFSAPSQFRHVSFAVRNYQQVLDNNTSKYGSKVYRKQAKFYLIQLDAGLYNYYGVVNGFQDPYSVRVDRPDYTNIQNGLGVFGSFNVDTLLINF